MFFGFGRSACCRRKNNSAQTIARYVTHHYPVGDCSVFATGDKVKLIGAAMANGMAANALDLEDGFSLLRVHPGAGFFGALLSAAEISNCTYMHPDYQFI